MGPDDEKRLRQLLFKKRQLPQPEWDLLSRVSKRWGRMAPIQPEPIPEPIPTPSKPKAVPLLQDEGQSREIPSTQDSKEDAFETLGVSPTASMKDIRNAYLKKAMLHHPDKGGDPELFKRIKAAYDKITGKE